MAFKSNQAFLKVNQPAEPSESKGRNTFFGQLFKNIFFISLPLQLGLLKRLRVHFFFFFFKEKVFELSKQNILSSQSDAEDRSKIRTPSRCSTSAPTENSVAVKRKKSL